MEETTVFRIGKGKNIVFRVIDDALWLPESLVKDLFGVKSIEKYQSGILKSNKKKTQEEGKTVLLYNINAVLSIGYRCNTVIAQKLYDWKESQSHISKIEKKEEKDVLPLLTSLSIQVFHEGEVFNSYTYIMKIIRSATKSIIVIDKYADENVLLMLSQRTLGVSATIITGFITESLNLAIKKYEEQYDEPIKVETSKSYHDRFIIIDEEKVYMVGSSIKDLGKKLSIVGPIEISPSKILTV